MPPSQRSAVWLLRVVCLAPLSGLAVGGSAEAQRTPAAKTAPPSVKPSQIFTGHSARVTSVAFAPDGLSVATAAWDATARLWDVKTGKERLRLDFPDMEETENGFKARLEQIAYSPDNAFFATLLRQPSQAQVVIVWKSDLKGKVFEAPGTRFAISPDSKFLAVSSTDEESPLIHLYEIATGKPAAEMSVPYTRVDLLAFSLDGKTLFAQVGVPRAAPAEGAARRKDGSQVRVWDIATGIERKTALEGAWNEFHLAVAPDGRALAVKAIEQTYGIGLRETATSGQRVAFLGHADDVTDVAFSPDGRTLASASADRSVRLWDVLTGQEIARLTGQRQWILSLAFSPDGASLVAGGIDKTALVWDVGPLTRRPLSTADRSAAQLEADWKDLAGDAKAAFAALGRLVSSNGAVSFLGQRLRSAEPTDWKRIDRMIGELDDPQFQLREQAMKELTKLGDIAVPALEAALADRPSLELKRRLTVLLERLSGTTVSADTVHRLRAVETLEWIGGPEARHLLETMAASPERTRVTREARLAAERLAKRVRATP